MSSTSRLREDLLAVVTREVGAVLGVTEDILTEETDLTSEFFVDSLEVMEIGTRVEQVLGFPVDLTDIAGVRTIGEIVDNLRRRGTTG